MDTIELKKIITSLLAEHADNNSTVVMSSIQADRPRTAIHQAHNAYGYSHSFSQKCLRVIYTHTQTYASSTISPSAATYQRSALLLKTPALLAHVRFPHTHTHTPQHVAPHPSSWRCNSGVVHQIPSIWSIQHFITLLYCHQSNGWQAHRLSCDMRHAGPCCDCWNMRKGTAIELDRFSYAELWVSSF